MGMDVSIRHDREKRVTILPTIDPQPEVVHLQFQRVPDS